MASILDPTKERNAHIDQRLRTDTLVWFHHCTPRRAPHAVAVLGSSGTANQSDFSQPKTQKLRNLQHNPNVLLA